MSAKSPSPEELYASAVRKIASRNVEFLRNSDAPGFEACVQSEIPIIAEILAAFFKHVNEAFPDPAAGVYAIGAAIMKREAVYRIAINGGKDE